jgi:hypothetical protein
LRCEEKITVSYIYATDVLKNILIIKDVEGNDEDEEEYESSSSSSCSCSESSSDNEETEYIEEEISDGEDEEQMPVEFPKFH